MFKLMPSMMTGIAELDDEHRELVEIINTLAAAEQHHCDDDAIAAVERFQGELRAHFQREEAYLDMIRFPGRQTHIAHHEKTLARLQEIKADFLAHTGRPRDTASVCFDELLRAVLQQDLEVMNWLADRRMRRK